MFAKNNRLDPRAIALFVATLACRTVQRDQAREHLAELVDARRRMVDFKQHATISSSTCGCRAAPDEQRRVRQIDADVMRLDRRIVAAIAADPAFAARDELLRSMPGFGPCSPPPC